jgi:hypothetical protein
MILAIGSKPLGNCRSAKASGKNCYRPLRSKIYRILLCCESARLCRRGRAHDVGSDWYSGKAQYKPESSQLGGNGSYFSKDRLDRRPDISPPVKVFLREGLS